MRMKLRTSMELIVNCQLSIVNSDCVRLGSFLTAEGAEMREYIDVK
jgi:hypothetical protein